MSVHNELMVHQGTGVFCTVAKFTFLLKAAKGLKLLLFHRSQGPYDFSSLFLFVLLIHYTAYLFD